MDTTKGKRKNIIILVSLILCLFFITTFLLSYKVFGEKLVNTKNDENKIVITQDFDLSTSFTDDFSGNYILTITGTIKNLTDDDLENVELTVDLKTTFFNKRQSIIIKINNIEEDEEYNINESYIVEDNYSKIENVSIKFRNGSEFNLQKYSNVLFRNPITILSLILLIVSFIIFISMIVNKETDKARSKYKKVEQSKKNVGTFFDLKLELEKEKMENELKELRNEKYIFCEYCGNKNNVDDKKCSSCGAILK